MECRAALNMAQAAHIARILGRLLACSKGVMQGELTPYSLQLTAVQQQACYSSSGWVPQMLCDRNSQLASAALVLNCLDMAAAAPQCHAALSSTRCLRKAHHAPAAVADTAGSSASCVPQDTVQHEQYALQQTQHITWSPDTISRSEEQLLPKQWQRRQPAMSQLDRSIVMSPGLQTLAGVVVNCYSALTGQSVVLVLNRLHRLHHAFQQQQVLQEREQQQQHQEGRQQSQLQLYQQSDQQQEQHEQLLGRLVGLASAKLTEVVQQLTPDQVVQVVYSYSQLQRLPGNYYLLNSLLQQLKGCLGTLSVRQLPLLASSLATLRVTTLDTQQHSKTQSICTGVEDSSNTTAAAPQPPELPSAPDAEAVKAAEAARLLLPELCQAIQGHAKELDAPGVARFVAAMAKLGHYDWQTVRHVGNRATELAEGMTPAHLVSLLVSFAKLHHYDQELCGVLASAAAIRMQDATGPQVAQLTWALAQLKHDMPEVFAAAAEQAAAKASELEPRHISNIAWAFAVRKAYSPSLYNALAARVQELGFEQLEPHHLTLLAWSMGKHGHQDEQFLVQLGDAAAAVIHKMLPQNISNIAWAYGRLRMSHPKMFEALSTAAKSCKLEGYQNQNITDLAWGFAATGFQDPELFEVISKAARTILPELSPHSLSDLTWAFAATRQPAAAALLAEAAPVVASSMQRLSMGMLADLLWSYAAVGVRDETLLAATAEVLATRAVQLVDDTESQAKILWGLKTLKYRDNGLEAVLEGIIPTVKQLLSDAD